MALQLLGLSQTVSDVWEAFERRGSEKIKKPHFYFFLKSLFHMLINNIENTIANIVINVFFQKVILANIHKNFFCY